MSTLLAAPTETARLRPLRGMIVCLLAGLTLTTIPFAGHGGLYVMVVLLALCVLGPIWYSWFNGRLDYFESIHVFGVIFFLYMGMGAVWTVNDPTYVAYDLYIVPYIPVSLFYCLLGYIALMIGYYGPWRWKDAPRFAPEHVRGPWFIVITGALGVSGYVATSISERIVVLGLSMPALVGTLSQLAPLFLFAWGLGWVVYFSGTATRSQLFALFGFLVPCALAVAFSTFSDKSLVITLMGLPVASLWYTRRKVKWGFLLVLVLILTFVIFPLYNTYRWSNPGQGKVSRMVTTVQTIQTWDSSTYMRYSLQSMKRRMAMINSVAVVVRDTGRWVPYAMGKTLFMPTLVFFVPRILWPDKPLTTGGREFGRLFRITNVFTRDTYIAPTIPGELYWNFDLPGVLIGMLLLGMAMRALYRRYAASTQIDPVRISVHILILITLAHLGGAIAPTFVAFTRLLLMVAALRWLGRYTGMLEVIPLADDAPAGLAPEAPVSPSNPT